MTRSSADDKAGWGFGDLQEMIWKAQWESQKSDLGPGLGPGQGEGQPARAEASKDFYTEVKLGPHKA